MASQCPKHSFSSYRLLAEEKEAKLRTDFEHSSSGLLIEHCRAIVTPHARWGVVEKIAERLTNNCFHHLYNS
jgi:hypothetical protein